MFSIEEVSKKEQYEQNIFAPSRFIGGAFLQSWEWGNFLRLEGEEPIRIIVKNSNGKPCGRASLVIKKNIPFAAYAYCPFGPSIISAHANKQDLEKIFSLLTDFFKKRGVTFLRFNPPATKKEFPLIKNLKLSPAKTKQPGKTLYLNLEKEPNQLLLEMKQKTRYNIKLAEKRGLTVRVGVSSKEIADFLRLTKITGERDSFRTHSASYYKNMLKSMGKDGLISLYTAAYKDEAIATNIIVTYGNTATYLHGASSNRHRNKMSTYLLQWRAIQDAQKKKLSYYDFWGFDKEKWAGVSKFKEGFGGKTCIYAPTYEIPLKKTRYHLINSTRRLLGK